MSQPANGTVIGVKRVGALCLEDGAGRDPVYCGHIRAREIVGERIALGQVDPDKYRNRPAVGRDAR